MSPAESTGRVRSPSPQKVKTPVKVPERFKSPEPALKTTAQFKRPEPFQAPLSPDPGFNREHKTAWNSMSNGLSNGNPSCTHAGPEGSADDPGLTPKKVVKVVRRVVRKVLPTEEEEPAQKLPNVAEPAPAGKTPAMSGFSFKHDIIKMDNKDDFTRGLTNLMVRGRTREPRPRIHKDERAEKVEVEKKVEDSKEVELEEKKTENKEIKPPQTSQHVHPNPTNSDPVLKEVPSTSVDHPKTASRFAPSRPLSLPSVVGFIPAPKPTPLTSRPGVKAVPTKVPISPPAPKPSLPPPSGLTPDHGPSVPAVGNSPGPLSPPSGLLPVQPAAASQEKVRWHFACLLNVWITSVKPARGFVTHAAIKPLWRLFGDVSNVRVACFISPAIRKLE